MKLQELQEEQQLWDVMFQTRISGVARVSYMKRHLIIRAATAKEAEAVFKTHLRHSNGLWMVFGWEMKNYSRPKKVTQAEADAIMKEASWSKLKEIYS